MIMNLHPGTILAEREIGQIVTYCAKHYGFMTRIAEEMTRLSAALAAEESKRFTKAIKPKTWVRQEISILLTANKKRRVEPAYGTGKLLITAVNNLFRNGENPMPKGHCAVNNLLVNLKGRP